MRLQMMAAVVILLLANGLASVQGRSAYAIVDTGQEYCYDDSREITPPQAGDPFYTFVGASFNPALTELRLYQLTRFFCTYMYTYRAR